MAAADNTASPFQQAPNNGVPVMLMRSIAVAAATAFALGSIAQPAIAQQNGKQAPKGKQAAKAKRAVAQGPKVRHQCKVGPYEKQTRLVMETVKDKPIYIAYWSSNGPFHCSFETWPEDGRAHWVDSSAGTVINLISGTMLIERNGDKYFVHAREVDRMPYCGTEGLISGVLTVPLKKGQCDWKETSSEEAGVLKHNESPAPKETKPEAEPPAGSSSAGAQAQSSDPG
jgi:hypothetical protein